MAHDREQLDRVVVQFNAPLAVLVRRRAILAIFWEWTNRFVRVAAMSRRHCLLDRAEPTDLQNVRTSATVRQPAPAWVLASELELARGSVQASPIVRTSAIAGITTT